MLSCIQKNISDTLFSWQSKFLRGFDFKVNIYVVAPYGSSRIANSWVVKRTDKKLRHSAAGHNVSAQYNYIEQCIMGWSGHRNSKIITFQSAANGCVHHCLVELCWTGVLHRRAHLSIWCAHLVAIIWNCLSPPWILRVVVSWIYNTPPLTHPVAEKNALLRKFTGGYQPVVMQQLYSWSIQSHI